MPPPPRVPSLLEEMTGRRPSARRAGVLRGIPLPVGRGRRRALAPPAAGAVPAGPAGQPAGAERQAIAASWALSNLGSQDFYNLCQRFIEQAYGTGGQYGSAAAAGKALFKTADPAEADVGDLVFFKPDASNGYAGHAAIYLGNGEMVGATNAGVTRDNIFTNPYWSNLLVGFGDPPAQWTGRAGTADLVKGAAAVRGAGEVRCRAPRRGGWRGASRRPLRRLGVRLPRGGLEAMTPSKGGALMAETFTIPATGDADRDFPEAAGPPAPPPTPRSTRSWSSCSPGA